MPRLVIKQGPGIGRDHALGGADCVVGRDASAHFVLEDSVVSRQHVKFRAEGGAWYVEDLGSTNGTLVNGSRALKARLVDGDAIRLGNTTIIFVQKDLFGGGSGAAKRAKRVEAPPPALPPAPTPKRRRRR